jgi:hypothetical protein
MESLGYTAKEIARRMKTPKFLLAATALAAALMVAFLNVAPARSQTSSDDASHRGQIYGTVQTGNMATSNQSRLDEVAIVVRRVKDGRLGKIVGFSAINNGTYAVNMGGLPAGKYVVMVDPGASYYMQGERLVDYPGPEGSKKQDWTIYTDQIALPTLH